MIRERIIISTRDRSRRWSLNQIAAIDDLTYSTRNPDTSDEATWALPSLPPDYTHPALRRGRIVEIDIDGIPVWNGFLAEPGGNEGWMMRAEGSAAVLARAPAIDNFGAITATPDKAIDGAIQRYGNSLWKRPASLSSQPFGGDDDTDQMNTIGDLLDAWAETVGVTWGVDLNWNIIAATPPTTPTWHMPAGSGAVGLADDDYASAVYLRYIDSANFEFKIAYAADPAVADENGVEEEIVDATEAGVFTPAVAQGIANEVLAAGRPALAWTAPVTPASRQLLAGGIPAFLPLVRAGQMVRLHGVTDPRDGARHVDFVIDKTTYAAGVDEIALTPPAYASRNLADALADLVESDGFVA